MSANNRTWTRNASTFRLITWVLAAALVSGEALADESVKIRLSSSDANVAVLGMATLQGQNLTGRIIADGTDAVVSGTVRNTTVTIDVSGRISPACGPARQFTSGSAPNNGGLVSDGMTMTCLGRGWDAGGDPYSFTVDLELPVRPLTWPSP